MSFRVNKSLMMLSLLVGMLMCCSLCTMVIATSNDNSPSNSNDLNLILNRMINDQPFNQNQNFPKFQNEQNQNEQNQQKSTTTTTTIPINPSLKSSACSATDFEITSTSLSWFYSSVANQVVVTGCFPSNTGGDYKVKIGNTKATITAVTPTTLTITTPTTLPSAPNVKTNLSISYKEKDAVLEGAFEVFAPVYEYVTPYSLPMVPGAEMRFSIHSFHPSTTLAIQVSKDDTIKSQLTIVDQQDGYVVAKLSEDFPVELGNSGFYHINFIDVQKPDAPTTILSTYNSLSIFHPSKNYDRYITHTVPSWLAQGGEYKARKVTMFGNGLSKATLFSLTHPFSQERLSAKLTPSDTNTDTQVSFDVKAFSWYNNTIFPHFNVTKYRDLDDYSGPIFFALHEEDGSVVASCEITIIPNPTPRFTIPDDKIPINYVLGDGAGKDIDQYVSLRGYYPSTFPSNLPMRIRFDDKWTLSRQRQGPVSELHSSGDVKPGFFAASRESFIFPLPDCAACAVSAEKPYTGTLCLLPASGDDNCITEMGSFTYLGAVDGTAKKPVITKTYPDQAFFDNLEQTVDVFFYGVKETQDLDILTSRIVYQHNSTGILLPIEWSRSGQHSMKASVPMKCAMGYFEEDKKVKDGVIIHEIDNGLQKDNNSTNIRKFCPQGLYTPLLLNSSAAVPYHQPIDVNLGHFTNLTLSFNPGEAMKISIPTTFSWKDTKERATQTEVFFKFLKSLYVDLENAMELESTRPIVRKTSKVLDNKNKQDDHTMLNFIIRPNSTIHAVSASMMKETINSDLYDVKSSLRKGVQHIVIEDANDPKTNTTLVVLKPSYTSVFWCDVLQSYQEKDQCKKPDEPVIKKKNLIIGIIIAIVVLVVLGGVIFFVKKKKSNKNYNYNDDLLLNSEDTGYNQIA